MEGRSRREEGRGRSEGKERHYIFEYEPKLWVDLGSALEMEMEKKIENEENDDDHNDVYQDKDDDDKDNDSETFIAHIPVSKVPQSWKLKVLKFRRPLE